jgi:hypothetical protein
MKLNFKRVFKVLTAVFLIASISACSLGITAGNGLNVSGSGTGVTFALDGSVVRQINTDSGNVTPASNTFSILGSGNVTTSASGTSVIIAGSGGPAGPQGPQGAAGGNGTNGTNGPDGATGLVGNITTNSGTLTNQVNISVLGLGTVSTSASGSTVTITGKQAWEVNSLYPKTGIYEAVYQMSDLTSWGTVITFTPSTVTGVWCHGILEVWVMGATGGVGQGSKRSTWYFDIQNGTPTVAQIGADIDTGSPPDMRLSLSGNNILLQVQSNDGTHGVRGTTSIHLILPYGSFPEGFTWSVS